MAKEIPSIFPCAFWPFVYLRGEKSIQVLGPLVKSGYWPFCCWGFNIFWALDPYRTQDLRTSPFLWMVPSVCGQCLLEKRSHSWRKGPRWGRRLRSWGKAQCREGASTGPDLGRLGRCSPPSPCVRVHACVCVCRRRARSRCAFRAPRVLPGTVVTVNILRSGTANSGQVLSPFHRSQVK